MKRFKAAALCFVYALVCAMVITGGSPQIASSTADDLFSGARVVRIEITVAADGVESLRAQPRDDVAATVRLDKSQPIEARVHLKGRGTFRPIGEKTSFTLKFPPMTAAGSGWGVRRLHLNNSVEDATYIQEQLGSEICRSAGIAAPRVGHAEVYLNGRRLGLYVFKEGFTREFLERSFGPGAGDLSEVEPAELLAAANKTDLEARWLKLWTLLDMDEVMTFLAVEVLICHWDGYATAGNNFRIYRDPLSKRFHFLPTGMDQLFGNASYPAFPNMTGRIARALMEIPEGRERFRARLNELVLTFKGSDIVARANTLAAHLRGELSRSEDRERRETLQELCERIEKRASYLGQQRNLALLKTEK